MAHYLLRRLLAIIPTLLAMTLITFTVMHAIPGSPFDPAIFGGNDLPQSRQRERAEVQCRSSALTLADRQMLTCGGGTQ
ncbi:MAG TPA: hypothetical protein VFU22_06580 [Roseiflexaceae bacterium]|nr:hypothetical protein [Roseiflexaceae bacterium]